MRKQSAQVITLKDVAKSTGFSLASVHRAINGKGGVSQETRQAILSAAREMGYTTNLMASVLKRKQINIAIVFPQKDATGKYYFNYMWKGCQTYIEEIAGYQINFIEVPFKLSHSPEPEADSQIRALEHTMLEWGGELDGLLTVPMENTPDMQRSIEPFIRAGVKVVLIDNDFPSSGRLCCIAPNDENTGRLSAELMCSMVHQQSGTILVAAGNAASSSHRMNAMGFADYVRTHRPELSVITVNDVAHDLKPQMFYERMCDPDVVAAYSVRARNTIPLCEAALMLEARRKLLVLGSDLFDESAEMLRRGVLKGIVYKNPYQKAYQGLKVLVEQLINDKPPKSASLSVPISIIMRNNLMFFEEFI